MPKRVIDFHSTMVRLRQVPSNFKYDILRELFPFHYGSIETEKLEKWRSSLKLISIPLWFD